VQVEQVEQTRLHIYIYRQLQKKTVPIEYILAKKFSKGEGSANFRLVEFWLQTAPNGHDRCAGESAVPFYDQKTQGKYSICSGPFGECVVRCDDGGLDPDCLESSYRTVRNMHRTPLKYEKQSSI
jgi:hypothetical protein